MDYSQVKHSGRLGMGKRGRREVKGWRPLGHYCVSNINGRRYTKVQRLKRKKKFRVNTPEHCSFNPMAQCFVINFSITYIYTTVIIMDFCECRMKMSTEKQHLSVYSRMCAVQIVEQATGISCPKLSTSGSLFGPHFSSQTINLEGYLQPPTCKLCTIQITNQTAPLGATTLIKSHDQQCSKQYPIARLKGLGGLLKSFRLCL